MGLITFNGQILLAPGGLANTKDCCCGGRNCYCFTKTVNYQIAARWRKCYRNSIFVTATSTYIYPDGMPCDGGENGMICPPGAAGRIVTGGLSGQPVLDCSCGSSDANSQQSFNAALVTSQAMWNNCTPIGSPP
jgi:hypothetical protein